jgi:hypothetical protein
MPAITFITESDAESAVDAILKAAGLGYDYTPAGFSDLNGFRVGRSRRLQKPGHSTFLRLTKYYVFLFVQQNLTSLDLIKLKS